MLNRYSPEQKEYFFQLVAQRYPVSECVEKLGEVFPEVKPYVRDAYYRYLKSEEGVSGLERAYDALREDAKTQSYAHRGSRVHALVEIAEKLLGRLRRFSKAQVGDPDYVRIAGEFRKSLQDIRNETEGLGLGDASAMDIFTSFASMLQKDNTLPDFVKTSLKVQEKAN